MGDRNKRPQNFPPDLPFYQGRSLKDAMTFMEDVMKVFRQRKTFPNPDSLESTFQLQPYHQSVPQNPNQYVPLIDRNPVDRNLVQSRENGQISERAKRAQEINQICSQEVRNNTSINNDAQIDGLDTQNNNQQTKLIQQTNHQNQPILQDNTETQKIPQNLQNENSLNIQTQSNNTSLFGNQTQEKVPLGYQNQSTSNIFANNTQENKPLGYQAQGSESIFGGSNQANQGTSSMFNNSAASSLGYQSQGTSSIFGNQNQSISSIFTTQIQQKSSLFSNQNQGQSSNLGYQSQVSSSLFVKNTPEKSQVISNDQSQEENNAENAAQKPSILGYQNQTGSSLFQKPNTNSQETQKVIPVAGLTIISEANSESTTTVPKSVINSTPQNTGGLFGSNSTSTQSNGLFSGGIFGRNTAQNQTSLGFNSANLINNQSTENVKPFNLGYQASMSSEPHQNKEKQTKNQVHQNQPQKVEQSKPSQQFSFTNPYNSTFPTSAQNTSSINHGQTIFTQKPKPNGLFANKQETVIFSAQENRETEPQRKVANIFSTTNQPAVTPTQQNKVNLFSQPAVTPTQPQTTSNSGNLFSQPAVTPTQPQTTSNSGNLFSQPAVTPTQPQTTSNSGNLFGRNPIVPPINTQVKQPAQNTFQNNQTQNSGQLGFFGNLPPQNNSNNTTQNREQTTQQATTSTTNMFNLPARRQQEPTQSSNIFMAAARNPPAQTTSNPFNIPSTNMFNQPTTNPFGTVNTTSTSSNIFGNRGTTSLFSGQTTGGASLFAQQPKRDQDEENDGSDAGEDDGQDGDDNNSQSMDESPPQEDMKWTGYNQTEIIYKLDNPAPKLKLVSTQSLRQNVRLSLQRFPEDPTIYLIVRTMTKTPIYFGILTKDSNASIFNESKGNFAMKLQKLVQIQLTGEKKRSLNSWRIQLSDNANTRGFFEKCKEIIKNLKENQK